MTVILFEDVKRTEPFARLSKAPSGGASAYGTLLQTPRAWWSIFIDVCFNRKRTGKTSWSLIGAAFVNFLALLAISPLSSALLTSEEVLVPKIINFTRIVPKADTQISMVPTTDTYYRTLNGLLRNVSTSAWISNTSVVFPFWPSSEAAQFGPQLASSYGAWKFDTTILEPKLECHEMTLESSEMTSKRYSDVYTVQLYGPLNGTQPMVTFVLTSNSGCRYELSMHPSVDMAYNGGVTWSDASTFYRTSQANLPLGGTVYPGNVSSTHMYARVNASEQCKGRDIILMSTPWTVPLNFADEIVPTIPKNQTYERSSNFRMRGLLCDSQYLLSKQSKSLVMAGSIQKASSTLIARESPNPVPDGLINLRQFQTQSMQDVWRTYFDDRSMLTATVPSDKVGDIRGKKTFLNHPGFSGMAPLLAALSNYNVSSMIDDPDIVRRAAMIKGRFFAETIRDAFSDPKLLDTNAAQGEVTVVETRVVVLTEIGFALAALFFASSVLLILIFWSSRLTHRPLNLQSDPASTVGLSLLVDRSSARFSTLRNMHFASRVDLYTALQREKYLTSNNTLIRGNVDARKLAHVHDPLNGLLTALHRAPNSGEGETKLETTCGACPHATCARRFSHFGSRCCPYLERILRTFTIVSACIHLRS